MIYGAVEFHNSDATRPGGGALAATRQVVNGLLQAALAGGEVSQAHFFSDTGPLPAGTLDLQRQMDEHRIVWQHLAMLPRLAESHEYVFVAADSAFGSVMALRSQASSDAAFPVCGIVHSFASRDFLGWLALGLLRAQPYDVLLATSHAVRATLDAAVDMTRGWFLRDDDGRRDPWIEQIPLAVDTDAFKPRDPRYCRDASGLPADATLLLCHAEPARGHNVDLEPVFAVLKEIVAGRPGTLLVVASAGDSRYSREIEDLARQVGVQQHVRVVSDVPRHARPLLYGASDAFVCIDASIHGAAELSALEAMASGVPVVAADWSGLREIVQDGVTGFRVPTLWNPFAAVLMSWLSIGESAPQFLAERTAVDARALRESLDVLVSRPERRAAMGNRARSYVETTHAQQPVARRLGEVWRRQRAECGTRGPARRSHGVDYARLFAHYATRELSADCALRIAPRAELLMGDDLRPPDTARVPPLLRGEAVRILERARCSPVSVGACLEGGTEVTLEAIVWLLRKAYVQPESPGCAPGGGSAHAAAALREGAACGAPASTSAA